jgi:hypothetical protein
MLSAVGLFVSCGGGRKNPASVNKNGLVTIDLLAEYPQEEISLQEIADVEYIPLAISDSVLLKATDNLFYISDKYIVVVGSVSTICVFNRAGKIVSHFDRDGRGPNEYLGITGGIAFDEKAEEFFVPAGLPPNNKILVFSIDGKHKRTLPMLPYWRIGGVWNFGDDLLLVVDKNKTTNTIRYDNSVEDRGFSTYPYHLISKADGSVVETLPMELLSRYSSEFRVVTKTPNGEQTQLYALTSGGKNKHYGGKDFTLVDMSSDTLYHYSRERVLSPVLVRTPSVHASEPRMIWSVELITEDFIVFVIPTLDFRGAMEGGTFPIRSLMYNFKTGRISDPEFINNDYSSGWFSWNDTETSSNTAVGMLDPLSLVEARDKGELSGPLAEIAATMKEDDNPVVMVVKFK